MGTYLRFITGQKKHSKNYKKKKRKKKKKLGVKQEVCEVYD